MNYLIKHGNIGIRKMEDSITDYNLMAKWLSNNELLDYYEGRSNSFNLEKVIKKYAPRAKGEEAVAACIIEHNEKAVGYIQYYPIQADEYGIESEINMGKYTSPYGIDLFIGEIDSWNQGIGTSVMKELISYLFSNKNVDIIVIDPQTWNKRAIKCYEKSGFIPRKVIENREIHDGEYKDSLIMSISAEEWKRSNMLDEKYSLCYAKMQDLEAWIKMVGIVRDKFPGLETDEKMEGYRQTVIKNIKRKTALCVKHGNKVVGVMLFSYNSKCLSCMAVHPKHRRKGIASALIEKMLSLFPDNIDITVTTFREDDIKGIAPRPLYKKYGFEEDELITEFDYPQQKFILHKNKQK